MLMEVSANRIKAEYDSGEQVLIQGIIDAYFEEEGDLVLVDYKTDKVHEKNSRSLAEKYQVQLEYYAEALERLTGKKVKEKYILFCGFKGSNTCVKKQEKKRVIRNSSHRAKAFCCKFV